MKNSNKFFGLLLVCFAVLSSGVFSNVASAAGTVKPEGAGSEASYEVIAVEGAGSSGGKANDCGLFDGTQVNEWNSANVMYWSRTSATYLEVNVNEACNIWRSGTSSWANDYASLKIYLWDGAKYNDVTSNYTQTLTAITNTNWEKTINNLQPGRYKFTGGLGLRIDSEWYLEAANTNVNVTSLTLDTNNKSLLVGQSDMITAIISPNDATNQNIIWSVDNPTVVAVSSSAITINQCTITGISQGTTTLRAKSVDGNYEATCQIVVTDVEAPEAGNAILDITFDNGTVKEYNLTAEELNNYLTWYDNRSGGTAKAYYIFNVKGTISPYKSNKNYVPYDKILYFDVKEY